MLVYPVDVIDDGPLYKRLMHRAVTRFESDASRWPYPPSRGGQWSDYWESRFAEILFRIGIGMRKLIEAGKVSVEFQSRPVPARFARIRGTRRPDTVTFPKVEAFYKTSHLEDAPIPLIALCHAIVHSYVLVPRTFAGRGLGLQFVDFFLASDRGRASGVHLIRWADVVALVAEARYRDDVVSLRTIRDGQGDELRIPMSSHPQTQADLDNALDLYRNLSRNNAVAVQRFHERWGQLRGIQARPI